MVKFVVLVVGGYIYIYLYRIYRDELCGGVVCIDVGVYMYVYSAIFLNYALILYRKFCF